MSIWKTACLLSAGLSLVSGAAQAQQCGTFKGGSVDWNLCVTITNNTQGTLTLEYQWNLADNSWGLCNYYGRTNLPPQTIAAGDSILTGSCGPLFGNVHQELRYVVHDVAGNVLGNCLINADSTWPGDESGITLSHICSKDPPTLGMEEDKGKAQAVFTYTSDGLEGCPSATGLLPVSDWKIVNDSGQDVVITKLAGWNRPDRVFNEHDAEIDTYLGSDSYQLAVSNVALPDEKDIFVRTCTSEFGSKEPDGSLYLIYQVRSSTTQELGPEVFITWSGTGKVVTESADYEVGDKVVTIKGG